MTSSVASGENKSEERKRRNQTCWCLLNEEIRIWSSVSKRGREREKGGNV
jgi:hypothetical protein